MFKNLNVEIVGNKIISKQDYSTPGVFKIFNIDSNNKYQVLLKNFDKGHSNPMIWIADMLNQPIKIIKNFTVDQLVFTSKNKTQIKVGVLFATVKKNHFFILDDIFLSLIRAPKKEEKEEKEEKDISVIIPCYYKHIIYVQKLLDIYQQQTLLPDEIILVISDIQNLHSNILTKLKETEYKYQLEIVEVRGKSLAGKNRLIGTKIAKGKIIIFQDADDIPHPQRIEIIKYFFDKFPNIVHIAHQFCYYNNETKYKLENISYQKLEKNIFSIPMIRKAENVTHGNIAIRKQIYSKLNWFTSIQRGQDVAINMDIFNKFHSSIFIRVPIYQYLINRSSKYMIK